MKLTKAERLILINQYKIMSMLESLGAKNNQNYVGSKYEDYMEILYSGYEMEYSEIFGTLNYMPKDRSEFVLKVLNVYNYLYDEYYNNFKKENIELDKDVKEEIERKIIFPGFDGNYEYLEYSYVTYLLDNKELYENIRKGRKDLSYNSHTPMIERYKKMLNRYDKINETNEYKNLRLEDLKYILNI